MIVWDEPGLESDDSDDDKNYDSKDIKLALEFRFDSGFNEVEFFSTFLVINAF